jgi:hypothetical protein
LSEVSRLGVQVLSTAVCKPPRTWANRGVVTGTLALVHTSGALEPLTFINIDPSIQELEYLASLITAHIQRREVASRIQHGQVAAAQGPEHGADEGRASPWVESGAEAVSKERRLEMEEGNAATGEANLVENELQPSVLTDIYRRPGFVDVAPDGARTPLIAAAVQQADVLKRLSAWDSESFALPRAATRLISHRATVRCDDTAQMITVTLAPEVAVSTLKAIIWVVCFAASAVLLEGLFDVAVVREFNRAYSETAQQEEDHLSSLAIAFISAMLVLFLVYLLGVAIMVAPRDVTLTVSATAWKLDSHLKGFKLCVCVPFLRSSSTGETNARCGCRVCALSWPSGGKKRLVVDARYTNLLLYLPTQHIGPRGSRDRGRGGGPDTTNMQSSHSNSRWQAGDAYGCVSRS